ncbi:MAG: hypothetical protein AVDCRST_MAG83-7, partial [uncultured Arthrobacter sp.]
EQENASPCSPSPRPRRGRPGGIPRDGSRRLLLIHPWPAQRHHGLRHHHRRCHRQHRHGQPSGFRPRRDLHGRTLPPRPAHPR